MTNLYIDDLTLTFKDIIPNLGAAPDITYYAPQFPFGDTTRVEVIPGDSISVGVESIHYADNQYRWEKDGVALPGQTGTTLTIYHCHKGRLRQLCS